MAGLFIEPEVARSKPVESRLNARIVPCHFFLKTMLLVQERPEISTGIHSYNTIGSNPAMSAEIAD